MICLWHVREHIQKNKNKTKKNTQNLPQITISRYWFMSLSITAILLIFKVIIQLVKDFILHQVHDLTKIFFTQVCSYASFHQHFFSDITWMQDSFRAWVASMSLLCPSVHVGMVQQSAERKGHRHEKKLCFHVTWHHNRSKIETLTRI